MKRIDLNLIAVDAGTQIRAAISEQTVTECGTKLPSWWKSAE